jgi:hypothetical protein
MNEAYDSNTYKYMVPSLCYTFDYALNLVNESCSDREIHARFLKHLLECILQNNEWSVEFDEIKLGDQQYKIMHSNQPKTIFPLIHRYFATTYSLFNKQHEETSLKSLLDKFRLNMQDIEEQCSFDEKVLFFFADPCMSSLSEYFNELSISENREKYVKVTFCI